jgi:2-polyprenyl-6-methoxyphenol hydroxylase-like FAD-dependent oxidoreductase
MQQTDIHSSYDIIIVGGGPVGLVMAHQLALFTPSTISIALFDRGEDCSPIELSKACTVHSRTLELLPSSISMKIVSKAVKATRIVVKNTIGTSQIEYTEQLADKTPYPFTTNIQQGATERAIFEEILKLRVHVFRNHSLLSLEEKGDGVHLTIQKPDNSSVNVTAKYVVGCDGAHSVVRKMTKTDFEGEVFGEAFYMADLVIEGSGFVGRDTMITILNKSSLISFVALPHAKNLYRVVYHEIGKSSREQTRTMELKDYQEIIKSLYPGVQVSECSWMTVFSPSARHVSKLLHGRIILAGDSAHVHSPLGAQGMNTGIGDAINLSWKLALVVSGQSPSDILGSYDSERLLIIRKVVNSTSTSFKAMVSQNTAFQLARDSAIFLLSGFSAVQKKMAESISNLFLAMLNPEAQSWGQTRLKEN